MPFIWNDTPNIPAANLPEPTGPTQLSTEAHVVANTVNAGGTLLYNTAAVGFDVVYELPSLNVDSLSANTLNVSNLVGGTAATRGSISALSPISYNSSTGVVSHAASGVTAGTYGDATHVPVVHVNSTGHITSVSNTAIVSSGSNQFPLWSPTNQQVGSGWAATQLALQTIIDNHRAGGLAACAQITHTLGRINAVHANLYFVPVGTVANVNSDVQIVAADTFEKTIGTSGSVVMSDGRVFCLQVDVAKIYDPMSDSVVFAGGGYPGGAAFGGYSNAILLPDGRVCCIPALPINSSTRVFFYSPATDSIVVSTTQWPGPSDITAAVLHYGAVLLPDGRIYCVPRADISTFFTPGANTYARIYNPTNDTIQAANKIPPVDFSIIPKTGAQYRGAILLPDGRVFLCPHEANNAIIYDVLSNTAMTVGVHSQPEGTPGQFWGGVLLQDGRVFLVPHESTVAKIYDPVANTLVTAAGTYIGNQGYAGGILLPDGRVYCVPYFAQAPKVFDPITNTTIQLANTAFGLSVGGRLLPDGRSLIGASTREAILVTSGFDRLPKAFVTSPFWNTQTY